MPIKSLPLTLTYTAWSASTNAPQTGDVLNHTLRLVRDGVESTPTNAPAEVDAAAAPGEYRLALTAAEMGCDFVTLCGVSATPGVAVIPVKLATEDGDLAALAATLALVKAKTDLLTQPTVVNSSGSAGVVVSSLSAYATAAQFLLRVDYRTVGRLLSDEDTVPTPKKSQVLADPTLAVFLLESSGWIEADCLRGGIYGVADLQALAGTAGGELLAGLVSDLTLWRVYDRRPDRQAETPPRCQAALKTLDRLGAGALVFGLAPTVEAGRLFTDDVRESDLLARMPAVLQGRRRYGKRAQDWR